MVPTCFNIKPPIIATCDDDDDDDDDNDDNEKVKQTMTEQILTEIRHTIIDIT